MRRSRSKRASTAFALVKTARPYAPASSFLAARSRGSRSLGGSMRMAGFHPSRTFVSGGPVHAPFEAMADRHTLSCIVEPANDGDAPTRKI